MDEIAVTMYADTEAMRYWAESHGREADWDDPEAVEAFRAKDWLEIVEWRQAMREEVAAFRAAEG